MKRSASIISLFVVLPAMAHAQERSITLEAPLETTLGDPIDLILTVTGAVSDEAAVPEQRLGPRGPHPLHVTDSHVLPLFCPSMSYWRLSEAEECVPRNRHEILTGESSTNSTICGLSFPSLCVQDATACAASRPFGRPRTSSFAVCSAYLQRGSPCPRRIGADLTDDSGLFMGRLDGGPFMPTRR